MVAGMTKVDAQILTATMCAGCRSIRKDVHDVTRLDVQDVIPSALHCNQNDTEGFTAL